MSSYENRNATQLVEDAYFSYDFEEEALPGKEDMEKLSEKSPFAEYMLRYAVFCGFEGVHSDSETLADFISDKCKEKNIVIGSRTKGTISSWLKTGLPANTEKGRENVYRLCFALEMDSDQTKEFFLKAYLERPFNYKNINEAVYFFCLKNRLTYADAQRIISSVEAAAPIENIYADNITEVIGMRLSEIETEEKLVQYLVENRSGFVTQNLTATFKIEELKDRCLQIAPKEYTYCYPHEKEITVTNVDELLSVIYGYAARATEDGKAIYEKTISKSRFPELVRRNWLDRERFAQILEKKTASYDVIRRALILLGFYDFFANAIVSEKEAEQKRRKTGANIQAPRVEAGLFDEFLDEMNTILSDCGYVQLYWRNPFDWLVGYCAMAPNPPSKLRELIDEYYLRDLHPEDE